MHEGHHGILEDLRKEQESQGHGHDHNHDHNHSHSHASSARIKIVSGIIVVLAIAGLLIWKTQF